MKQNIDDLHSVVSEARLRKKTGEVRQDVWKEDLHPREATRARTIPVLAQSRDQLIAELQQVCAKLPFVQQLMLASTVRRRKQAIARKDASARPSESSNRQGSSKPVGHLRRGTVHRYASVTRSSTLF